MLKRWFNKAQADVKAKALKQKKMQRLAAAVKS
jgi:hypothetical protein